MDYGRFNCSHFPDFPKLCMFCSNFCEKNDMHGIGVLSHGAGVERIIVGICRFDAFAEKPTIVSNQLEPILTQQAFNVQLPEVCTVESNNVDSCVEEQFLNIRT